MKFKEYLKLNEGATDLATIVKASSNNDFLKKFRQIVKREREEYGNDSYSGSWASIGDVRIIKMPLEFKTTKFNKKNINQLIDYLLDTHDKWEPALAVKTSMGYVVAGWAPE